MSFFNERAFLLRALAGVFVVQFATVGYLTYSCQTASSSGKEENHVTVICNNAANSYNETGKLALTTILALLVPSSSQKVTDSPPAKKRKEETPTS
jgi:hypothetical protein